MTTPTIAVVGGGLGGPLLARVLQKHGFEATLYESETGMDTCLQGATLDLHAESGQLALKEAGLYDEFLKYVRPNGEERKILDKTGRLYDVFAGLDLPEQPREEGRPEVDRQDLRSMLVGSLEPGMCWGKKLAAIAPLGDGRHTLSFTDGSRATYEAALFPRSAQAAAQSTIVSRRALTRILRTPLSICFGHFLTRSLQLGSWASS